MNPSKPTEIGSHLAIIGMAGRFPGAAHIDEFWEILRDGKETVKFLTEAELLGEGLAEELLNHPDYVRAKGVLAGIDLFDATFFGYSPREAELTDPQQRLFLECAWSALEHAGYVPDSYPGRIGVFAGMGWNSYLCFNLASHPGLLESPSGHQILLGNEKDNLTTRVSYKLNLRGPSIDVQTGCSTSLVAVCVSAQSLLSYQCDLALAGGVSVSVPQTGYLYQPGGILSADGHCRVFDARAQGTVPGNGVGVVVLKRLEEAVADRDYIWAVIRGSAVNNDGAAKAAFTAPSIDGQAEVIVEAQALAEVAPETISYIEAHGTGTNLGDPIEIAALTRAFRLGTSRKNFCAIGSVKTNIGHLDAAAGIAGLIKTTLALKHKQIPASLHFERPNREINFAETPFYVNTTLSKWERTKTPRRAGVSSFGLGGTNAHVIVEEGPQEQPCSDDRMPRLLVLSARSAESLERTTANLIDHLKREPKLNLADVAHTLQRGRKHFSHRRTLVFRDRIDAIRCLEALDRRRVFDDITDTATRPIAFMFTGQGSQYVNMARDLYETNPSFRAHADACFELLAAKHDLHLREIIYPENEITSGAARLKETENAQLSLFVIEYALAEMWKGYGITSQAVIGHSLGEYVAATIAGMLSLEDALLLVLTRARLMRDVPNGSMLAVPLAAEHVPYDGLQVSLAAVNGPANCVFSGPTAAITALQERLSSQGIEGRYLDISHAFHSQMIEPMIPRFSEVAQRIKWNSPSVPVIAGVTGTWMQSEENYSEYWVKHLRQTVRFYDGLGTLLKQADFVFLEVGPGRTLTKFVQQYPERNSEHLALCSLPSVYEKQPEWEFVLGTLGRLWLAGANIDWSAISDPEHCRRVPLPTYPFERQRYWIDPPKSRIAESEYAGIVYWKQLVSAIKAEIDSVSIDWDKLRDRESRKALDDLCLAYMHSALRQINILTPDTNGSPDFSKYSRYEQLLSHWLKCLRDNHKHKVLVPSSEGPVAALLQKAKLAWAHAPNQVDLVQKCGEALVDVLRDEKQPLELFTSELDERFSDSRSDLPLEKNLKLILCTALKQVVKVLAPRVKLRILEVGGGTGIITKEFLPLLPKHRTDYVFSDVGNLFLSEARRRFSDYPFVRFGLLDIEKPPLAQGYAASSFDVVVAINVLHATRNLDQTLQNVRSLLAPNGILLIWEISKPILDFAVTYGLLMNPVLDPQRSQGNPFLSPAQWRQTLLAHGFANIEVFPGDEDVNQHVFIAQMTKVSPISQSDGAVAQAFTVSLSAPDDQVSSSALLVKKHDIADWFYVPSWKRTARSVNRLRQGDHADCWLVLADSTGLADQLSERLKRDGATVFSVKTGTSFERESEMCYLIDPAERDDYIRVFRDLRRQGHWPVKIVHLWSFTVEVDSNLTSDSLRTAQVLNLHSLFFIAQAIAEEDLAEPVQIEILTNNLADVTGEEIVAPEKALLLGPAKVIPLEFPYLTCRTIDITGLVGNIDEDLADQLIAELQNRSTEAVVAFRGRYRWVQTFEPVRLDSFVGSNQTFRNEGVYLIAGGLGEIGMAIATYLAANFRARLILVGRSDFPAREHWSDWLDTHAANARVSKSIERLFELESLGSEVLVVMADVADMDQVEAVVEQAEQRFGAINGVIHAAGVLGDNSIQRQTVAAIEKVLKPKTLGTIVLDTIFRDKKLDFFVLCSSVSASRPAFGQFAYAAANNFLDAFAHAHRARREWIPVSINWDVWQGRGMAYKADAPQALQRVKDEDFRQRGILPVEGAEVLNRILASNLNHVLVSTSDYLKLLENERHDMAQVYLKARRNSDPPSSSHPRPQLRNSFVAPENETEESLAAVWQEVLGIDDIGINDDFFELGGDSLLGTLLISRIKTNFGVQLPMKSVYLHPTIKSMSAQIELILISQAGSAYLDKIIDRVKDETAN